MMPIIKLSELISYGDCFTVYSRSRSLAKEIVHAESSHMARAGIPDYLLGLLGATKYATVLEFAAMILYSVL